MANTTLTLTGSKTQFIEAGRTAERCGFHFVNMASGCGVDTMEITYREQNVGTIVTIMQLHTNDEEAIMIDGRMEVQNEVYDLVRMVLNHHNIKFSRHF